jgi:predicted metal-dependent phosphoesterase TrpH
VIDLHLHTTASDGRSSPEDLVREAAEAGLRTIAVTDHDTTAAVLPVAAAAHAAGLVCVPGIEMTAVIDGRDVHILGYFLDPDDEELNAFLASQREERRRRVVEIGERLARAGAPVDTDAILSAARGTGRSVGRPLVAHALIAAGYARDIPDAFDRFLSEGRPGFVERRGAPPVDVVARINRAGGLASLAHPGKLKRDDLIPDLAANGLAAVEVFHPDHSADDMARYAAFAAAHGLCTTGGSDYHGPGSGRTGALGRVLLPSDAFAALAARAGFSGMPQA